MFGSKQTGGSDRKARADLQREDQVVTDRVPIIIMKTSSLVPEVKKTVEKYSVTRRPCFELKNRKKKKKKATTTTIQQQFSDHSHVRLSAVFPHTFSHQLILSPVP